MYKINNFTNNNDIKILSQMGPFTVIEYLRDLISIRYRSKVQLLPTTDGDMYKYFSEEITKQRKRTFKNSLLLVWLATSSNLKYLEDIVPLIDRAARELKHRDGRDLILKVICEP